MSLTVADGDVRERVYVDRLNDDPCVAARKGYTLKRPCPQLRERYRIAMLRGAGN